VSASSRPGRGRPGSPVRPARPPTRADRAGFVPGGSETPDPFAINPVRRSFGLVSVCSLVVFGPLLVGGDVAMSVMVSVGWLAVTGIVMGVPILIWSLVEEGWRLLRRRLHPTVDQLELSPRVVHVLVRHGYDEIEEVDRASDASLLLLSNMDARGLRELRRAVSLWKYRRWQEEGFPATGYD
jgi:Bacterial RNA polymerase, alpha chain C terminal domain